MKASRPFSETLHKMLKDPELAALYLEDCLEDGDMELFTMALRDVADARGGMAYLAEVTHLNRETLYRTLSKDGNPRLDTLYKILAAMGLRIGVSVQHSQPCT
ncbi:MAG TPA: addiction module antidote protein [Ktedonobacteraceae bacterium]|jgi:probable addiction module antidote protein